MLWLFALVVDARFMASYMRGCSSENSAGVETISIPRVAQAPSSLHPHATRHATATPPPCAAGHGPFPYTTEPSARRPTPKPLSTPAARSSLAGPSSRTKILPEGTSHMCRSRRLRAKIWPMFGATGSLFSRWITRLRFLRAKIARVSGYRLLLRTRPR